MALAWTANAGALSLSMLARAPSLMDKPEQVEQQPFQARERDRLAKAQVEDEGAQVRPERRARLQPGGRRRLEPLVAAGAGAAMQRHPGHVRRDRRNFDAVISLERNLARGCHRRPAMWAVIREHVAPHCRLGMQRSVRPRMDLALRRRLRVGVRLVPFDGGMLELSGVLGGCSTSTRSAAFSAFSAAFSASRWPTRAFRVAFSASSASTRAASPAIRASSAAGSVLVSDQERAAMSAGEAMRRLPHKPHSAATKIGSVIADTQPAQP